MKREIFLVLDRFIQEDIGFLVFSDYTYKSSKDKVNDVLLVRAIQ